MLSWTTQEEVLQYYAEKTKDLKTEFADNRKKEQWKTHDYFAKIKDELVKICQKWNMDSFGKKHEMVKRISANMGEESLELPELYASEHLSTTTK